MKRGGIILVGEYMYDFREVDIFWMLVFEGYLRSRDMDYDYLSEMVDIGDVEVVTDVMEVASGWYVRHGEVIREDLNAVLMICESFYDGDYTSPNLEASWKVYLYLRSISDGKLPKMISRVGDWRYSFYLSDLISKGELIYDYLQKSFERDFSDIPNLFGMGFNVGRDEEGIFGRAHLPENPKEREDLINTLKKGFDELSKKRTFSLEKIEPSSLAKAFEEAKPKFFMENPVGKLMLFGTGGDLDPDELYKTLDIFKNAGFKEVKYTDEEAHEAFHNEIEKKFWFDKKSDKNDHIEKFPYPPNGDDHMQESLVGPEKKSEDDNKPSSSFKDEDDDDLSKDFDAAVDEALRKTSDEEDLEFKLPKKLTEKDVMKKEDLKPNKVIEKVSDSEGEKGKGKGKAKAKPIKKSIKKIVKKPKKK